MEKVLLLYNIASPEYKKEIRQFCAKRKVRIRFVEPQEYDIPLGFVAYGSEEDKEEFLRKEKGREFSEPMMLFSGFEGQSLFEFLRELRIAGIGTADLKAMMTENNAVWTSVALFDELSKEHRYMQEMRRKRQEEKAD